MKMVLTWGRRKDNKKKRKKKASNEKSRCQYSEQESKSEE